MADVEEAFQREMRGQLESLRREVGVSLQSSQREVDKLREDVVCLRRSYENLNSSLMTFLLANPATQQQRE